jgi:hypothetical protein
VDHEMKLLPLRVAGLIVGWKSSERKRRGDEQQEGLNDGKAVRRTPACRRYGRQFNVEGVGSVTPNAISMASRIASRPTARFYRSCA